MQESAPRFASDAEITLSDLERYASGWLADGEVRQLSPRTLEAREDLVKKLTWFLRTRERAACGIPEIRAFLAYVNTGHGEVGGRWDNARMKRAVKPRTTQTYFGNLKTLFRFLVSEGALAASPIAALRPPVVRSDQVQPFTPDQVNSLLDAARRSRAPRRNEAILILLLDTGARVSEVCGLRVQDVDLQARYLRVTGKGNKQRTLWLGAVATRTLWAYMKEEEGRGPGAPFFLSISGRTTGEKLTRSGVLQLLHELGRVARLDSVRCSPHTMRHTFAVEFLRSGGNVYALQEILGHTTLAMVRRYLALAQADIENQHRQHSPADRLRRRR